MAIELKSHKARPHAGNFALELLADEHAPVLGQAARRALASIASRDRSDASAMEWAFLSLSELRLGLAHLAEAWCNA